MYDLFRLRSQKKKKDNVEGQSSAGMLKPVVKLKTDFFFLMRMNYAYYFILLMHRLYLGKRAY